MKDFSKLDSLINSFVEQGSNPGCAVAVMQGDELIYHGEAGYADIESGKKVDVHSMFSQASTRKESSCSAIRCIIICRSGRTRRNMSAAPMAISIRSRWKSRSPFVMRSR